MSASGSQAQGSGGVIESPRYPNNYPLNVYKVYPALVAGEGNQIKLTFTDFNVEHKLNGGCWDWVKIEDEDGNELMGETCGTNIPDPVTSKSMKVIFSSDDVIPKKGFRAFWEVVSGGGGSTPLAVEGYCGEFTKWDMLGPKYIANTPHNYTLAPESELSDRNARLILEGQILDENCVELKDAIVEVWYAGTFEPFPVDEECVDEEIGEREGQYDDDSGTLWYRGKQTTDEHGEYKFLATFPRQYGDRPLIHYHFQVTTTDDRVFITQAYFQDVIPGEDCRDGQYLDETAGRDAQYLTVTKYDGDVPHLHFNIKPTSWCPVGDTICRDRRIQESTRFNPT